VNRKAAKRKPPKAPWVILPARAWLNFYVDDGELWAMAHTSKRAALRGCKGAGGSVAVARAVPFSRRHR
jgi:hypothetical protein